MRHIRDAYLAVVISLLGLSIVVVAYLAGKHQGRILAREQTIRDIEEERLLVFTRK
jgi:hypothetical protein